MYRGPLPTSVSRASRKLARAEDTPLKVIVGKVSRKRYKDA